MEYTVSVSDVQRRIIINALEHLKYKQIESHKQHDSIDDIILKMCDAEMQNEKSSRKLNYEER
ncbi:MAG: hypothetical protein RR945_03495 [Erysipelotrichaceae bacterium]